MAVIRPIALAVPRRGADLLVAEYHDAGQAGPFYRPIGGGIEFGETAEAAVRREVREELGTELLDVRQLGVLENIFRTPERAGHEIVFVFAGRLADPALYERDVAGAILDEPGTKVRWLPLQHAVPLYPVGLAELLLT